jgi:hypothetical protein
MADQLELMSTKEMRTVLRARPEAEANTVSRALL